MGNYDKTIIENMQWLNTNKVEKYSEVYNILLNMYENYRAFYDDSIKLNVSTTSSVNTLLNKGQTILEKYNRILIIMPDLKEGIESQKKH